MASGAISFRLKDIPPSLGDAFNRAVYSAVDLVGAKDSPYIPFSEDYHRPNGEGQCFVCLAGALMAENRNITLLDDIDVADYSGIERNQLLAIEMVRIGAPRAAMKYWGVRMHADLREEKLAAWGCKSTIAWQGKKEFDVCKGLLIARGNAYKSLGI